MRSACVRIRTNSRCITTFNTSILTFGPSRILRPRRLPLCELPLLHDRPAAYHLRVGNASTGGGLANLWDYAYSVGSRPGGAVLVLADASTLPTARSTCHTCYRTLYASTG